MALTCCSWVNRLGRVGPAEQEEERDQAAGHVQPVEPGGDVEHRAVVAGRQGQVLLADQVEVLVALAAGRSTGPSGTSARTTRAAPSASGGRSTGRAADLAALDREHAHLAGHAGGQQHQGVDRGQRRGPGCTGGHGSPRPLSTERIVKYMANSAAKNISSEDSQMMVPTLTRFGLLAGERGVTSVVAVATGPLLRHGVGAARPTPQSRHGVGGARPAPRPTRPAPLPRRGRPSLPPHRAGGARPAPRVGSIQFHEGRCLQP